MTHAFHGRKEWAERTPSWSGLGPVRDIFGHHDVFRYQAGFEPSTMRALERAEISRGGYIALAYHTLVTGNGDLVECRPAWAQGGATMNRNGSSRAIVLPGNYHRTGLVPSEAQIDGMAEQIWLWVAAGFVVPDFHVYGHRQVFPTACNGDQAFARLPDVERLAHEKVAHGGGTTLPPFIPPAPAPPGGTVDWAALKALTDALWLKIAVAPLSKTAGCNRPLETRLVQSRLGALGYSVGVSGVDGCFGGATERAVMGFQRGARLKVDGIVGAKTGRALK